MTHRPSSGWSSFRTSATLAATASRVAGPVAPGRSFGRSAPKRTCCRSGGMPTVLASPSPSLRTVSENDLTCAASPGWPHRMSACRTFGGGRASAAGPAGAGPGPAAPFAGGAGGWSNARAAAIQTNDTMYGMSLVLHGDDFTPPDLGRLPDPGEQFALRGHDLVRVDAV